MSLKQKLTSRKFWMAVASAVLVILNDGLGLNLPTNEILIVVAAILGYIFVEGAADVARIIKS